MDLFFNVLCADDSLGIVMWEMSSRRTPFDGEELGPNGRLLRQRIAGGLRPDLALVLPGLHNEAYLALMQRCWDADPAKREARLSLLARMRDAVHQVADFSRIEG